MCLSPYFIKDRKEKVVIDDKILKEKIVPFTYEVARNAGTERAFSGKYWDLDVGGTYYCAICGNKLFHSHQKFYSTCGWPSFMEAAEKDNMIYKEDLSFGMKRIEVLCSLCDSHLGHIFNDGPPPSYKRFCINSEVIHLDPDKKDENE